MEWAGGHYTGESSDGAPHGYGTMTYGGTVYEGQWNTGSKEGQGTETYADGSVYQGDWLGDKIDGTMTYADGSVYEGSWENPSEVEDAEWHGKGTFTSSDGFKFVGEFRDGNPWNGTEYDKNGNEVATYSEGIRTEK